MRTAGNQLTPAMELDEGWRDLVSSAPPPPPPLPQMAAEKSQRTSVPADVTTDRHGCVTNVQFGEHAAPVAMAERPSFDASDRRMWMVAGGLMGLATLVLLLLGVLTFRSGELAQSQAQVATAAPIKPASALSATVAEQPAVGSARPLIAQHALRHSKHARKHKKIASVETR